MGRCIRRSPDRIESNNERQQQSDQFKRHLTIVFDRFSFALSFSCLSCFRFVQTRAAWATQGHTSLCDGRLAERNESRCRCDLDRHYQPTPHRADSTDANPTRTPHRLATMARGANGGGRRRGRAGSIDDEGVDEPRGADAAAERGTYAYAW